MAANENIILLNDTYEYVKPPIPSDERQILYHDLPKKHQYWRSEADLKKLLDIRDVRKMSERDRIDYIEMWRNRWLNGMYFFNNGEPEYINGLMVDHLVFNTFNSRKLVYTDSQRDDFFFRELVLKNDEWEGMCFIKPRRYGMTLEEVTTASYVLLSGDYHHIAIQSDTQDKAKTTILQPLIDSYISRPKWMREDYYKSNGKTPINSLKLKNVVDEENENKWLGGIVTAYPTSSKAVDGKENMYVIQDEFSKWPTEANPRDTLDINKKTVRNFGRIGKVSCLSTTGDSDEVIESTREWIKLIGESTLFPGQKRTNSGLVKRFVSAVHSKFLDPKFTDKYGKVDHAAAEEEVHRQINQKPKGTKAYYFEMRKLPLTEKQAIISSAEVSYFRKVVIEDRITELNQMPHGFKPYVRGNLEEGINGKVYFENNPEGKWLISLHPYFSIERGIDTRNRGRRYGAVFQPPINPEFVGGYDPIRYEKGQTTSQNLSRASAIFYKKWDYYHVGDSNRFAALYLERPDDPTDGHREVIKGCKYFGAPLMHERNIESVKKTFDLLNCLPYLLKEEGTDIYGMYTSAAHRNIKDGIDMMVTHFSPPKEEGQEDQLLIYPFEDGLLDKSNFDIANTTKFDVMMSEIMLFHGMKQIPYTSISDSAVRNALQQMQEIMPKRN